ncbi:MAG: hypothetical protein ACO398_03570 [Kiritimatiellia bacterium]
MSPAKKLAVAASLYRTARRLKVCALKKQHPDWSESRVEQEVREIFIRART